MIVIIVTTVELDNKNNAGYGCSASAPEWYYSWTLRGIFGLDLERTELRCMSVRQRIVSRPQQLAVLWSHIAYKA